ncbi:hypothetical protein ACIBM8_20090 [Micromonospora aurantiaca]|uniref:hypothetical protein n=1 Tax=Micromonospora aurantiaca (nom. illeg.) TaxID=47850 RepID=UPI0037A604BD
MTTAEKITAGIALLGALGVGALLKSWVDHLLARREKRVNIADKSVQMAATLMTRMEAELTRAQSALTEAQKEGERVRAELGLTGEIDENDTFRVYQAKRKMRAAYAELNEARNNIHGMRVEVGEIRERGGLGKGVGRLIPTPPPVDEDVWAEMVSQHEEDEQRRGPR